jgi:hypothetical protein
MKEGCLFVLFCFVLGVFGKLSTRREVHGLGSMTFELAVQKFLNIE